MGTFYIGAIWSNLAFIDLIIKQWSERKYVDKSNRFYPRPCGLPAEGNIRNQDEDANNKTQQATNTTKFATTVYLYLKHVLFAALHKDNVMYIINMLMVFNLTHYGKLLSQ